MKNHNPKQSVPGSTGGQSVFAGFIDHTETYGPHLIKSFLLSLAKECEVKQIADIGAGSGRDLQIAHEVFPDAKKIAIEAHPICVENLRGKVDCINTLNIERDCLPFVSESMDIIIANQVLEHTKEIFWIMHEITRSLKVNGHFLMGVPNIASFHNRILLMFGRHPTQHKLYSAHVRPFSKQDTINFMNICFPEGYELLQFAGSQFYPFPPRIARIACKFLPNMAFSIFFLFRKVKPYKTEFLDHPLHAQLETPFFIGEK